MRSSIIAAAFAAGAAAVPLEKRAVVTDYDVVYYTQVVTVTQGAAPTTTVAVDPETTAATTTTAAQHYGHHWKPWHWTGGFGSDDESSSEVSSADPTSETSAPAPAAYTSATSWATTWTSSWSDASPTEASSTEAPSTYAAPSTEAPSSTYVPSSSAAASSAEPSGTGYSYEVIRHHNLHRQNHTDTGDLEWDDGLAATAQKIAESCTYAHNTDEDGGGYGQNIAAGVEAKNIGNVITDMFYNGEINLFADQYGKEQPDMTNFEGWGHFTQLVWKDTTHVGCYTQTCDTLANVGSNVPPYFTVCNYKNAGNYANEYAANVKEPLGQKTINAKDVQ
ncbi:hypothetical protein KC343_g4670 [Hortaea werneckii]|uniref:SCP domain-containing protein n=1 Tax=Hortaea werneckii TaxID=91943 RepID=A0A3M7DV88_HORWE|nr:hypothetical protein KC343_g4670 [Hortaea werneckii]RMY68033.1 hypothetical protein D0864_11446 [Hortaea werneckii]